MFEKYKELNMMYAYKIAGIVSDAILGDIDDTISGFDFFWKYEYDYFNDLVVKNKDKILQPNKVTFLHIFIEDVFQMSLAYEIYHFRDSNYFDLELDSILNFFEKTYSLILDAYGKKTKDYIKELEKIDKKYIDEKISDDEYIKEIEKYIEYFEEKLEAIISNIINDVFYLLYNDKLFLMEFNGVLASYVNDLDMEVHKELFDDHGNVKRCGVLPQWLKRALFFKANGICQKCGKDLSGTLHIAGERELQYDHVIPLAEGGSNDPTNFQLLCQKCNLEKTDNLEVPKVFYRYYW